VQERKALVAEKGSVPTLTGIKSRFELCDKLRSNKISRYQIFCDTDGSVSWRRFPCNCHPCRARDWVNCELKHVVGTMEEICSSGQTLYK
jgi:hypothetical protein